MLNKIIYILSIALITSTLSANEPSQERALPSRKAFLEDAALMSVYTACFAYFTYSNHNKKHSGIKWVFNNKIALCSGALTAYAGLLAISRFTYAAFYDQFLSYKQRALVPLAQLSEQDASDESHNASHDTTSSPTRTHTDKLSGMHAEPKANKALRVP